MRLHSFATALVLALGLATGACGGDDGNTYETQGAAIDVVARATCERLDECDKLGEATVDQCVTTGHGILCDSEGVNCDGPLPDGVTSDEIDACADAASDAACDTTALPTACQGIGVGSFAPSIES